MKKQIFITSLMILFVSVGFAHTQSSTNYQIEVDVFSGGGGQSTSANYILTSVIGQPTIIGVQSSTSYADEAGYIYALLGPPEDYVDTIQKIFIGYYQRPAAPAGLNYWSNRLSETGGNQYEIVEAFANSPESQRLYGPINSGNIRSVVTSVYWALFNRPPAQAGLNFYENGFNSKQFTAATIMLNVLDGATGTDLQSVNNKVTASNLFTRTIDPDLDGMNFLYHYSGDADAQQARNFLSTVNWDPGTSPTQDEVTLFIQNNLD